MEPRKFKNRDIETGIIIEKSYTPLEPTLNDVLTADFEGTLAYWISEGFDKINPIDFKHIRLGEYVKYVTTGGKIRVGGVLMVKKNDYIVLRNMRNGMSWSVQHNKTLNMYTRSDITPLDQEDIAMRKMKDDIKNEAFELMSSEYLRLLKEFSSIINSQDNFYDHMKTIETDTRRTWVRSFIKERKTDQFFIKLKKELTENLKEIHGQ